MKKRFFSIILMISFLLSLAGCSGFSKNKATIFVATDTHYLSSSINDGGKAFEDMIINSDGKMAQYCDEIFDAFSNEVIVSKPDVLVLSGDLTFNGEKASHKDFVKKLKHIQDSGVQVLAIAGNHDIDSKTATQYKGDEYLETENINAMEFKDLYYDFGMKQAISVDDYSLSYLYKVNEKLYVLMLDTNAYGQNFVQDLSYKWIEEQLKLVESKGAKVITVSHQNLFAHNDQLSFGYQLYDGNELLKLYQKYNVPLNLSGHIHLQHYIENDVTEIATSSLLVSPSQYGIIDVNKNIKYKTKAVDVAKWAEENQIENKDLKNFASYANAQFFNDGLKKSKKFASEMSIKDDEKEEIATAFATLNTAYFAGKKCDKKDIQKGIDIAKNQSDFMSKYILTMSEETHNDYNSITIKTK